MTPITYQTILTRTESGRMSHSRVERPRDIVKEEKPTASLAYDVMVDSKQFTPYTVTLPDGTSKTIQVQSGLSTRGLQDLLIQEFYRRR